MTRGMNFVTSGLRSKLFDLRVPFALGAGNLGAGLRGNRNDRGRIRKTVTWSQHEDSWSPRADQGRVQMQGVAPMPQSRADGPKQRLRQQTGGPNVLAARLISQQSGLRPSRP